MVGLLLLGATGCTDEIRSHFTGGTVVFNDRLRADKGATAGLPTPRFFSDGGSAGDEIISEVYHSLIAVEDLRKLRRSECLWVQQDGFPLLSYEALLDEDFAAIIDIDEESTIEITADTFSEHPSGEDMLPNRIETDRKTWQILPIGAEGNTPTKRL